MTVLSVGFWSYDTERFDSVAEFLAWCEETHGEAPRLASSAETTGIVGEWHQVGGRAPYSSADSCDGDLVLVDEP
jgi:hypothetical protein